MKQDEDGIYTGLGAGSDTGEFGYRDEVKDAGADWGERGKEKTGEKILRWHLDFY